MNEAEKPVLIFGAGQVAQVFDAYLRENGFEVAAFVVDDDFVDEAKAGNSGRVVWPASMLPVGGLRGDFQFVVGMSFKGINKPRADKFKAMRSMGYKPLIFIDLRVSATGEPSAGDGSFIMDGNVIQPGVEIGDNTILWSGNHVGHHTKIGSHVFIASHAVISGAVTIEDYCFIGVNATIRDGVRIGEGCVIGANAVILQDCEPGGVYGAIPTKRHALRSDQLRSI